MKLLINGKEEIIEQSPFTINELLKFKEVKMPEMVSIELNDQFLDKKDFGTVNLADGDRVEFLYFMGGGEERPAEGHPVN